MAAHRQFIAVFHHWVLCSTKLSLQNSRTVYPHSYCKPARPLWINILKGIKWVLLACWATVPSGQSRSLEKVKVHLAEGEMSYSFVLHVEKWQKRKKIYIYMQQLKPLNLLRLKHEARKFIFYTRNWLLVFEKPERCWTGQVLTTKELKPKDCFDRFCLHLGRSKD